MKYKWRDWTTTATWLTCCMHIGLDAITNTVLQLCYCQDFFKLWLFLISGPWKWGIKRRIIKWHVSTSKMKIPYTTALFHYRVSSRYIAITFLQITKYTPISPLGRVMKIFRELDIWTMFCVECNIILYCTTKHQTPNCLQILKICTPEVTLTDFKVFKVWYYFWYVDAIWNTVTQCTVL